MLNVVQRFRDWRERERAVYEEKCRRSREIEQRWETEFKPLSLEEAKRRAEVLLADPTHFRCETDRISDQERRKMDLLAPHVKAFFERFSEVKHVHEAGEYLQRSLLWLEPPIMEDRRESNEHVTIGWMGGADLRDAKLEQDTDLTGARYDRHTRWPQGLNPQQRGAVKTP
jgi:hypothetical protein